MPAIESTSESSEAEDHVCGEQERAIHKDELNQEVNAPMILLFAQSQKIWLAVKNENIGSSLRESR